MYLLRFLTVFAVVHLIYAGTGQGIEPGSEKPSSKEVEESVKQEVFLKTANAEPIEIDRVKRFEAHNNAPVQSLRRTQELDEVTVTPASRIGYGTQKDAGIGYGTSGGGSSTIYGGYQRDHNIGQGTVGGGQAGVGSGTVYGGHQRESSIGQGTVGGRSGIGSGTVYNGYDPNVGHGGRAPAIGSGTSGGISDVGGVGYGTFTTRRTPYIGSGTEEKTNSGNFGIGKGTTTGDSKGGRVHLNGDPDSVNTELGGEVKIGRGTGGRSRRDSQFDRFDTGFAKECNSYYGRLICYRVYTNPSIITPAEYTCWKISNNRKNCTEVDNIVYLKNQGFQPDEYELPRNRNRQYPENRDRQHPRPRQDPEEFETSNSQQHPRPRQNEYVLRGQDRDYSQNLPPPRSQGSQGNTYRFVTTSLKLGRDSSLEADDNRELYRQKRKRAVKTKKPYYIPPDYEIIDEFEEMKAKHKIQTTAATTPTKA